MCGGCLWVADRPGSQSVPIATIRKSPRGSPAAADRPAGLLTSSEAARALPSGVTGAALEPTALTQHWKAGTLIPAKVVKNRPYWDLADLIAQWRRKIVVTVASPEAVTRAQPRQTASPEADDGEHPDTLDLIHQKTRLTREQCRLAEIKRKEHEGSLISLPAVTLAWQSIAICLRDTLMGIGGRLADQLVGLTDSRQIRTAIDAEVRSSLVATDAALGAAVAKLRAGAKGEPEPEPSPVSKPTAPEKARRKAA